MVIGIEVQLRLAGKQLAALKLVLTTSKDYILDLTG